MAFIPLWDIEQNLRKRTVLRSAARLLSLDGRMWNGWIKPLEFLLGGYCGTIVVMCDAHIWLCMGILYMAVFSLTFCESLCWHGHGPFYFFFSYLVYVLNWVYTYDESSCLSSRRHASVHRSTSSGSSSAEVGKLRPRRHTWQKELVDPDPRTSR